MLRALQLARRGMGRTSPNPCVGAVLLRGNRIIGEGWHRGAGLPHAEVEAIQNARRKGKNVRGATLYVTLEPCSTWGRTPPCTNIILANGIRRVVVGTTDPNPKHNGRGYIRLRKAGIKVQRGILQEECEKLNRAWNHWVVNRTPWVIAKCGMSLDGKIATTGGKSQWITGNAARREAHRLRAHVDAILVGINTVLADNPQLTVRSPGFAGKQPLRVVLDTHARTPSNARILNIKGDHGGRVWIMVGKRAPRDRIQRLERAGACVYPVDMVKGRLSIRTVLQLLGRAGVVGMMVEGGGSVLGSFFCKNRVQEVVFFIAPMILGGQKNVRAVAGAGFPVWSRSLPLKEVVVRRVGRDLMVRGKTGF